MPKYLIQATYTAEGAKGLLSEGGTKRRDAAAKAIKAAGGKVEAFYFAFGKSRCHCHHRPAGQRERGGGLTGHQCQRCGDHEYHGSTHAR